MNISLFSIGFFCFLLIAIGFLYSRKTETSDYHIASRRVGMWRIGASTFTLLGGGEIITMVVLTYVFGLWALSYLVGAALGAVLFAFCTSKIRQDMKEKDLHTLPDYFHHHLGRKSGLLSFLYSVFVFGAVLVLQLIIGGALVTALTGIDELWATAIIAATVAIYVCAGGFNSILVTDIIQAIAILATLAIILFMSDVSFGESYQVLMSTTRDGFVVPDILGFLILGMLAAFGSSDFWQRAFSGSSDKQAKNGLFIAAAGFIFYAILMVGVSANIQIAFPGANPNDVFFQFLAESMSGVLAGVVGIFLVSSLFSTVDTELFLLSIMFEKEYKRLKGKKARLNSTVTRGLVLVIIAVSFLVALKIDSLVDLYLSLLYFVAIMAPVAIARILGRGNDWLSFTALLLSGIVLVFLISTGNLGGLWPVAAALPGLITFISKAKKPC